MSGASVFFYGRRSRSNRSFDDLGFASSSSSTSSSSSSSDRGSTQHHRGRKIHLDRRHRHNHHNLEDAEYSHRASLAHSPAPANELQQGFIGESPSRNSCNREAAHSSSGRLSGNRLPLPVLLAKERLVQRLRGVSVSGSSSNGETETSSSGNSFWEVDVGLETSNSRGQPPMYNYTELPFRVRHHSASQQPNKKLPGLTEENLSQLHHDIYQEHPQGNGKSKSNECSICLENFVQGNELISLGCGHRFHTLCLYPWLQTCGECPNCRSCIVASSLAADVVSKP